MRNIFKLLLLTMLPIGLLMHDAHAFAPVADFVASDTALYEGDSVTFTDLSTNTPTSW